MTDWEVRRVQGGGETDCEDETDPMKESVIVKRHMIVRG